MSSGTPGGRRASRGMATKDRSEAMAKVRRRIADKQKVVYTEVVVVAVTLAAVGGLIWFGSWGTGSQVAIAVVSAVVGVLFAEQITAHQGNVDRASALVDAADEEIRRQNDPSGELGSAMLGDLPRRIDEEIGQIRGWSKGLIAIEILLAFLVIALVVLVLVAHLVQATPAQDVLPSLAAPSPTPASLAPIR